MGSGKLMGKPDKKLGLVIRDGAITTHTIADRAVTPDKLSGDVVSRVIYPIVENVRRDLQQQISSLNAHGVAVSDSFGPSPCIGISQRALSEAFLWLCEHVSELSGKDILDVKFEVSPSFSSEPQAEVTVTLVPPISKIGRIALFINDEPVDTEPVAENYSFTTTINRTSNVKVEYDYFGKRFIKQKMVRIGDLPVDMWSYAGSGEDYQDVYRHREYLLDYEGLTGIEGITIAKWGDRILIVMDNNIHENVEGITMSGFKIPFDVDTETLEGYAIYTSKKQYIDGTWPIEISMRAA